MAEASATEILVGTYDGEVILVEHANGNNLSVKKQFTGGCNGSIHDICAYKDVFVAVGERKVQVWNKLSGQLLHTFQTDAMRSVAIIDDLIVIGGRGSKCFVHQNRDGYDLVRTIDLRKFRTFESAAQWMQNISFLNDDIIMVTTSVSGIYFVSVQSVQCISHSNVENSVFIYRASVLSDGRVCVGGSLGYCALFEPIQEIADLIGEYVESRYSEPSLCNAITDENVGKGGTIIIKGDDEAFISENATGSLRIQREKLDGGPSRLAEENNDKSQGEKITELENELKRK